MKGYLKTLILIIACLAVLTPFASNAPDGLERVTENLRIETQEPIWKGLMPDYSLPTIDNPYVSTIFAGTFGVLAIVSIAYIVGTVLTKSKKQ